jgi:hypothetical protein
VEGRPSLPAVAGVVQAIRVRDQPLLKLRPGEQRPSFQDKRAKQNALSIFRQGRGDGPRKLSRVDPNRTTPKTSNMQYPTSNAPSAGTTEPARPGRSGDRGGCRPIFFGREIQFRTRHATPCRGSRAGLQGKFNFARDTRATTAVEAAVPAAREVHFARETRATTVQNKNAPSDFFRQGVLRGSFF